MIDRPIGRITSAEDILTELDALAALDPRLLPVIETAGSIPIRRQAEGLRGLCAIVVAQQVSKASADAIFRRLEAEADLDDHDAILALDEGALRRAGLSRPKQATIRELARARAEGTLDFARLASASGRDAIADLVKLRGIGVWTAECYLLFAVGHRDVFPVGDLALQEAVRMVFGLEDRPKPEELSAIAESWAPHRSTAARLFWAYYATRNRRDGTPVG
ncbi:putative dna-3-methyladenine glycosidase ii protein [Fulvimarina pelagi HTCC2506]|uniref:DNA-3-methyladenine glycosylase II n=1 Tax=Fulvimarina pelagi HTCC2506 TaxID=314231 RepID=Q0G7C6_9HYPH|nr:DNA-3-methyladenine glycosylase [Fulvimarina pelagi]EAU42438.1 putative dna-3-methyladenine glycosidase ii protein [Fulvimarina pelagi HTCC2506]